MKKKSKRKPRLNDGLCPEKFEICVPERCKLLGEWNDDGDWTEYVERLAEDHGLAMPDDINEECGTGDCWPGRIFRGDLAIAHACEVHDKIHRQILGFEKVSAVDVGFVILERQTAFDNVLAIRVHVNQKLPPEKLSQAGLTDFTQPPFTLLGLNRTPSQWSDETDERQPHCCDSAKWRKLKDIVRRELRGQRWLSDALARYPISGVRPEDLSLYCPDELDSLDDVRLCICGVPIDIVNAQYDPSITHPGGDADKGVFTGELRRSNQLSNREQLLIGRGRVNPIVGGVSVGSITGQAGTLSTIVWDQTDGTPCVLSNWHVLAGTPTAKVDQPTYQPALFDGGTEDDVVARLKRWTLGEEGDAAIAELSGTRHYASGEILGMWHPISGYLRPRLNMEIRKWGRTTGFTKGFIDGIHLATNIDYGNGVVRYFKNQFHISPRRANKDVSQTGDSGSLVLTRFRPLDMQRDLKQLCEWLRLFCYADDGTKLCEDIEAQGKDLADRCDNECPQICDALETALAKLLRQCLSGNYSGFCDVIRECQEALKSACGKTVTEDTRECAAFLARVDQAFDKLHEKAKESSTTSCRLCEWIDEALSDLECPDTEDTEICKDLCAALSKAKTRLQDGCKRNVRRRTLCKYIGEEREKIRQAGQTIQACIAFCADVTKAFNGWYERCQKISENQDQTEIICNTLSNPERYKPKACKDPSALVKRILKELAKGQYAKKAEELEKCVNTICDKLGCKLEEERSKKLKDSPKTEETDPMDKAKEFLMDLASHLIGEDEVNALEEEAAAHIREESDSDARSTNRAYYAVGMIFAGDTPGSPFGEFAVVSDIERLAEKLRFSLRPVFEPRSSFRELRERPLRRGQTGRALRSRRGLTPGALSADPRGGGPQPDPEHGVDDIDG